MAGATPPAGAMAPLPPMGLRPSRAPQRILLIGAHCDDIEIGCGGLVQQLAAGCPGASFLWCVFGGEGDRVAETMAASARLLEGCRVEHHVAQFRNSFFPQQYAEIKAQFEQRLKPFEPDLVLTHARNDLHQDHRVTCELTWNTFRRHQILEYEIPKWDGDLGQPNLYVPLTRAQMERKIEVLMSCFPSQLSRSWFTPETFSGLARIRGIECNAEEGYAEAFHGRKQRLAFG